MPKRRKPDNPAMIYGSLQNYPKLVGRVVGISDKEERRVCRDILITKQID